MSYRTNVVFCSELIVEHDVTPSAVMLRTWLMPRHGEGKATVLFCAPRPVNTISFDFKQFSFKLFVSAQSCTCLCLLVLVSELTAGTIMCVSSANLISELPMCIGWRSDAVTTEDVGPIAEPWMTLAKMSASSEVCILVTAASRRSPSTPCCLGRYTAVCKTKKLGTRQTWT